MAQVAATPLWKAAFIEHRSDASPQEQAFFRMHLEQMRERVEPIAARIFRDMPGYTVHDSSVPTLKDAITISH